MKRERSWTRIEYTLAYRDMRRGISVDWFLEHSRDPIDIIKAADYSYQAYGYDMHGWTSDRRRKRFLEIKWRILSRQELPF